MVFEKFKDYKIILASKSPRRQQLLRDLGFTFEIITRDTDESFPKHLQREQIPIYLCQKKVDAFNDLLQKEKILVITADTIVWVNDTVLNKPENFDDAVRMLKTLSGNCHIVYTGVCIKTAEKKKVFYAETEVHFKALEEEEIHYYIHHYHPFDKAGSYGIQEWLGYMAMHRIDGSFYNVMGLPTTRLYQELKQF